MDGAAAQPEQKYIYGEALYWADKWEGKNEKARIITQSPHGFELRSMHRMDFEVKTVYIPKRECSQGVFTFYLPRNTPFKTASVLIWSNNRRKHFL